MRRCSIFAGTLAGKPWFQPTNPAYFIGLSVRLAKLKLAGFKTFVDPTTVLMPGNLVGVVGLSGVVVRETQAYLKRK